MKRLFTIISAALLTGSLALPAVARAFPQTWPQPTSYRYYRTPNDHPVRYADNHPYVADFNNYFDSHPETARQLSADPRLVDNPRSVADHPGLRDYLWSHPLAADSFRHHPARLVHNEHVFNHLRWDNVHHRWCR
jgi:hypothetical protein